MFLKRGLLWLCCCCGLSSWGLAQSVSTVSLQVLGSTEVSELERAAVDRGIAAALSRSSCALRLDATATPPDLTARLQLVQWRERDVPGGQPILDTQTGRDRPGHLREVEVEYQLTLQFSTELESQADRPRRFVVSRGTERVPGYDPARVARSFAIDRIADDVRGQICKRVKSERKRRARADAAAR